MPSSVLRSRPGLPRPWGSLNIQWLADIVEAVPGCYSEFVEREDSLPSTKVTIFNNGPLRIEGDFEIVDQEGKAFGLGGRTAVSLCRCGHSSNSPFCDGTHKRQSFTSAVTARDLPGPPKP